MPGWSSRASSARSCASRVPRRRACGPGWEHLHRRLLRKVAVGAVGAVDGAHAALAHALVELPRAQARAEQRVRRPGAFAASLQHHPARRKGIVQRALGFGFCVRRQQRFHLGPERFVRRGAPQKTGSFGRRPVQHVVEKSLGLLPACGVGHRERVNGGR